MPGSDFTLRNQDYARQLALKPAAAANTGSGSGLSFSFDDLLDIVNPLQHIPVISTIYKHLTGDKIGIPEKIAGDALYGGLMGFFCSVGDAIFTEATGKSVGDTIYAAVFGDDEAPKTAVAANETPVKPADSVVSMNQAAAAYRASGQLLAAY